MFSRLSLITILLSATFLPVFLCATSHAQTFTILAAGELNLKTDQITDPGNVRKYFGMDVSGSGNSFIRVNAGNESAQRDYEFRLSETQLKSFLLSGDLSEGISPAFVRGVKGSVLIEILNQAQEVQTSVVLNLNVRRSSSSCGQSYPSCKLVKLDKAAARLRRQFVRKFVKSLRGPIILEPKVQLSVRA